MRSVILLAALAACSDAGTAPGEAPAKVVGSSIVGLYERAGIPDQPSRICIIADGEGHRFGYKSSYEGPQNCSAKGRVVRSGSTLEFAIDGDPACSLSATVTATGLMLGKSEGPECSYYCAANAELEPGPFEKVGSSATDARRAVDLVGEPLC